MQYWLEVVYQKVNGLGKRFRCHHNQSNDLVLLSQNRHDKHYWLSQSEY